MDYTIMTWQHGATWLPAVITGCKKALRAIPRSMTVCNVGGCPDSIIRGRGANSCDRVAVIWSDRDVVSCDDNVHCCTMHCSLMNTLCPQLSHTLQFAEYAVSTGEPQCSSLNTPCPLHSHRVQFAKHAVSTSEPQCSLLSMPCQLHSHNSAIS
jgi:hypothetical protein